MYTLLKGVILRLVQAPGEPPEPPAGSHGSVEVFRASPSFLTYSLLSFFIYSALSYLIPLVLVVVAVVEGEPGLLALAVVTAVLCVLIQSLIYCTVRIDYDLRYYVVTDRSLRVREGAWVVKEKTITFANVQNLRVVQGPLMRLFGIWHLMVDTAGGRGGGEQGDGGANLHSVRIAGIVNAHQVRDRILSHLRRRGLDAGLGDLDDRDRVPAAGQALTGEVLTALAELKEATAALRVTVGEV